MTDRMTVLRCHDSMVLTKTHTSTASGIATKSYGNAKNFEFWVEHVDSLDDIIRLLVSLARQPHACVIRGEPAIERAGEIVQRRCIPRDGEPAPFSSAQPGRRWCAFDFDDFPLAYAAAMDSATIAAAVRASMPQPWRDAAAVYRLSASAGVNGWDKVSLHLWFWLDRPVFDKSIKNYAKSLRLGDSSLFSAVQVHYTADPIFIGMDDPVKQRLGMLPGEPMVKAPAELLDAVAFAESMKPKPQPTPLIQYGDDRQKSAQEKYAEKALQSAAADIRSQGKGNRNPEAHKQAYSIGGYVGAGVLDGVYAGQVLTAAIQSVVGPDRYAKEADTVQRGIIDGAANPRDMSRIGLGREPKLRLAATPQGAKEMPAEETTTAGKVPSKRAQAAEGVDWPDLGEKGAILSTAANLWALLDCMGYTVKRNLMSHQTEWDGAPADIALECLQGAMSSIVIDEAARYGWKLAEPAFWRGLGAVEARCAYHPVVDWAKATPWDGESRFAALGATLTPLEQYAEFAELMQVQLERWLIAGGHCLALGSNRPEGVSIQGVLVIQGRQDLGKTRWFRSLLPESAWLAEGVTLDAGNTDSVIAATSAFLVELGELDATTKKSDVSQLKSFLTRAVDKYRAAYGRKAEVYPRRTLFGATVNPEEFLIDPTGNRRYWMMPMGRVDADHGINMQQVWAEALARAEAGEAYWMPDEFKAQQLALANRFEHRSEWADDFFNAYRLPRDGEHGQRLSVRDIRARMYPDRRWTQSEMRSLTTFLRSSGASMAVSGGIMHAVVVPL